MSKSEQERIFNRPDDRFTLIRSLGISMSQPFEVGGAIPLDSRAPKRAEWQDRGIIPLKNTGHFFESESV